MNTLTATQRGDLAERLLPIAARIACIVRGDGGPRDIHQAIRRLSTEERDALLVVMAGLVDPDTTIETALGYLDWDEHGRPIPPELSKGTLRGLAGSDWYQRAGAGPVLESERIQRARYLYLHDGLSIAEVAQAVGAAERTVTKWKDAGGWRQVKVIEADVKGRRRRAAA